MQALPIRTVRQGRNESKPIRSYVTCSEMSDESGIQQLGASTSDSSYGVEMYKEVVWEERDSVRAFVSKVKLFDGLSADDQTVLHGEIMKAWLPYMFGVWTAMHDGVGTRRCYTSPNSYIELNVDVTKSFMEDNFTGVTPYIPFDFDLLGKQFYEILSHHHRRIAPLFRPEDSDIDHGIRAVFIAVNCASGLSQDGQRIMQNARNRLFRELHKYCQVRRLDFAEKMGELLSFYHVLSEGVNLFDEILSTMQVHCGPDHFFYMTPRRIQRMMGFSSEISSPLPHESRSYHDQLALMDTQRATGANLNNQLE
uniref:NR LBD domain-containing protein n=1 Tax=Steinernema glaseri TaxID=37863 RepID=A0A1I8AEF5_9BILA